VPHVNTRRAVWLLAVTRGRSGSQYPSLEHLSEEAGDEEVLMKDRSGPGDWLRKAKLLVAESGSVRVAWRPLNVATPVPVSKMSPRRA
jgi:hypothetical protein